VAPFDGFALDSVLYMLNVQLEARMMLVVNRHPPAQMIPVGFLEAKDVGHGKV
jgi:hypothetical protein